MLKVFRTSFGCYVSGVQFIHGLTFSGAMLSNDNPLYIGMKGCSVVDPGYFKGRMDDVSQERFVS